MNLQAAWEQGFSFWKKGDFPTALSYFKPIVAQLEPRPFDQLSAQEQYLLIRSYSCLATEAFSRQAPEEYTYAEKMYACAVQYFVHIPDDLDLYAVCLTTMCITLMYEQAYGLLIELYQQGGKKRELALQYLAGFEFEADGFTTEEEYFRYGQELFEVQEKHGNYESAYKNLRGMYEERGKYRTYALKFLATDPNIRPYIPDEEFEQYKKEYAALSAEHASD